MCLKWILLFGTIFLLSNEVNSESVVTCYWNSWSVYRTGIAQTNVRTIDGKLCTHVIYNTAAIDRHYEVVPADPWNDLADGGGKANYKKFVQLKDRNPHLKVLLAIGGWNTGSIKFSELASEFRSRKTFIDSTLKLTKTHGFDGVNINWQFPNRRGGKPYDKRNYGILLEEMYEVFQAHKLLLTIDMSASPNIIMESYDVPVITNNVDFIHLTAFDYSGYWDAVTGLSSALYNRPGDHDARLNVNYTIGQLKDLGMDLKKIVLIVSAIGQAWTLADPSNTSIGAKAKPGNKGKSTQHPGILSFTEICEDFDTNTWNVVRDNYAKVPYAYREDQWISYDDAESAREKRKYAVSKGLAGIGLHSLDNDDFRNICKSGRYPLLKAITVASQ